MGQFKVVECLVSNKKGCDVNAKDNHGRTALHLAAEYGYYESMRILVKHGCDINAKDNRGWTALHYASAGDYEFKLCEILIDHGCDINAKTNKGETALDLAGLDNKKRYLKQRGAC